MGEKIFKTLCLFVCSPCEIRLVQTYFFVSRASIVKYISFREERLPRKHIIGFIKEIDTAGNFNRDTLENWKDLMSKHNIIE